MQSADGRFMECDMKNRWLAVNGWMMGLCLLVTGCMESVTVVQVRKDGSGALHIRDFISDQALGMMQGFEEMAALADAEGQSAEVPGWDQLTPLQQNMLSTRVNEFGAQARLVSVEAVTNEKGWKGYRARLAFDDINALNLATALEDDAGPAYQLAFTPGDVAELRIMPQTGAAEDVPDTLDLETAEAELGGMMEGMNEAMLDMFRPMFAGMRMSLFVEVEGEIVETNAAHQSAARPNRIALLDVDFDQVLSHPEALAHMANNQAGGLKELQALGITGVLAEDPDQTVTIKFQ